MKGILTSITYQALFNQTFVDLFIRCEDKKRRRYTFKGDPHFYIKYVDFPLLKKLPDQLRSKIKIGTYPIDYFMSDSGNLVIGDWVPRKMSYVDDREVIRLDIPTPGDCPPIRNRLHTLKRVGSVAKESGKVRTFEADIPYVNRWLIDSGIKFAVEVTENDINPIDDFYIKSRYWIIDIEAMVERERISVEGPEAIITLGIYDSYEKKYYILFIGHGDTIREKNAMYIPCADESFLLNTFYELLKNKDPDILMGFNLQDYDLPKIVNRSKHLGVNPNQLSPIGNLSRRQGDKGEMRIKIQGREIIDLFHISRFLMGRELRAHNLDYVNRELGAGIGKLELPGDFNTVWQTDKMTFLRYNKRDLDCVLEVELEQDLIRYLDEIRRLTGVTYQDILYPTTLYDIYMMRKLKGERILPTKRRTGKYTYPGAYVYQPVPGLYHNVVVIDFSSLYPNIFITFNIGYKSMSTEYGEIMIAGEVDDKYAKERNKKKISNIKLYRRRAKKLRKMKEGIKALKWDKKANDLEAKSLEPETKKVKLYFKADTENLISEILQELLDRRVETKKKIRDATTKEEIERYSKQDQAFKVLVNSAYGVMGRPGFRLYKAGIGEAVTVASRQIIHYVVDKVKSWGYDIFYGDTDSAFIVLGQAFEGDPVKIGKEIAERLTNDFKADAPVLFGRPGKPAPIRNHTIKMDMEAVYETLLIFNKKNYLSKISWKKGKYGTTYQWTGRGERRSDYSKVLRTIQLTLGKSLVDNESWDIRKGFLDNIQDQLIKKELTFYDLGTPKQLGKRLYEYKTMQTHVRGAMYSNDNFGTKYNKGDKPMWAYAISPEGYPETDVISYTTDTNIPDGFEPDYETIVKKGIQPSIDSFLGLVNEEYKIDLEASK